MTHLKEQSLSLSMQQINGKLCFNQISNHKSDRSAPIIIGWLSQES